MKVALSLGPLTPPPPSGPPPLLSHWRVSWTVPLTLILRLLASAELWLCRTSLLRLIISRTIRTEWTLSRWSPLACCRMSLERIVGTYNIPAALMTVFVTLEYNRHCTSMWLVRSTKAAERLVGFQRPRVILLEKKETYNMTSGAS